MNKIWVLDKNKYLRIRLACTLNIDGWLCQDIEYRIQ